MTNSMRSRDSLERRLGFDEVMKSDFPAMTVLPSIETYDDPARMASVIADVVENRPGVVGLYSMGLGNAPLLDALREAGRAGDLVVIAHELTPKTREALQRNELAAVITQNVGHLVRSALRVLRAFCDEQSIFEAQERIRIEIVLRENLY